MRRSIPILWLFVAALVALPQGGDAQGRPQTREGFFIGFGFGGGSMGCTDCVDREAAVTGHLKLGGSLSPQLLLGVQSSAWTKEESGARLTHTNVSAVAQFHPVATAGLFFTGGVGFSTLEAEVPIAGVVLSDSQTGLGLTAGLGYDVRVGTNFSVTPYGLFGWGDFETLDVNVFQLGLGVTWH